jgi:hypothetical protein
LVEGAYGSAVVALDNSFGSIPMPCATHRARPPPPPPRDIVHLRTIQPRLLAMAATGGDETAPAFRFKRRKLAHPRRSVFDDTAEPAPVSTAATSADAPAALSMPQISAEEPGDGVPNLKEIIRNRKRPQHRMREVARKAEQRPDALVPVDAPKPDLYRGKFVAQTGQVVDQDDKQM